MILKGTPAPVTIGTSERACIPGGVSPKPPENGAAREKKRRGVYIYDLSRRGERAREFSFPPAWITTPRIISNGGILIVKVRFYTPGRSTPLV
jgi:hypothetical protein